MNGLSKGLIALIILISCSSRVYAIDFNKNCKVFFKELLLEENDYLVNYKELLDSMGDVEKAERSRVLLALDALHFISYYHQLDELLSFAQGKIKVKDADFPRAYNRNRRNGVPNKVDYSDLLEASIAGAKSKRKKMFDVIPDDSFPNFLEARHYLIAEKPEFSVKTFKKLQTMFMKGKVDGLPQSELGKYRSYSVVGNVPEDWAIGPEEYEEVLKSAYIGFEKVGETKDGRVYGYILYPHVDSVEEKTLKLIQSKNKKLVTDIKNYQDTGSGDEEVLNRKLIEALVDDAFAWFAREKKKIGEIKTPARVDKYIELTAEFQRKLISIHPFADGNGRTTREFGINYALMTEGLPPSRLINPDDDLYSPMQNWKNQVKWGVLSTHKLVEDIT